MSGTLDRLPDVGAHSNPGLMTGAGRALGYADRLTLDVVPHGSLDGYRAGCRAESACPARRDGAESCLRVGIRYAGDWQYRRLIDAGHTPAEAAAAVDASAAAARRGPARAPRPRRARSEARTGDRVTAPAIGPQTGAQHGTMRGYVAGCRAADPCPASPTCAEISAATRRRWRKPASPRPIVHGKRQGYARGCRTDADCPNSGTDQPTCAAVSRAYHRARYAARREVAAA